LQKNLQIIFHIQPYLKENKRPLKVKVKTFHSQVLIDTLLSKLKVVAKVRLFEEIFYLIFSVHYQMKRGIKNIYPS